MSANCCLLTCELMLLELIRQVFIPKPFLLKLHKSLSTYFRELLKRLLHFGPTDIRFFLPIRQPPPFFRESKLLTAPCRERKSTETEARWLRAAPTTSGVNDARNWPLIDLNTAKNNKAPTGNNRKLDFITNNKLIRFKLIGFNKS